MSGKLGASLLTVLTFDFNPLHIVDNVQISSYECLRVLGE